MIYGYARISTPKQKIQRQIDNISKAYPTAIIQKESYTGTTTDRPEWNKLMKKIRKGDTIVFDEVSRMSRDAEDGFKLYEELYAKGVELIFLKESTLNTENFRNTRKLASVGEEKMDILIDAMNKVLMILAKEQIKKAFETAQAEVDFLHQRTSEGVRTAISNGAKCGGLTTKGTKLTTKKSVEMKKKIFELSKSFNGSNSDKEVMQITGLSRNTFYKYKRELMEE